MENQKRIVYLTFDFLEPIFSGNGTLSRIQIFGLLERGFKVLVFCPDNKEEDPETSKWVGEGVLEVVRIQIESDKNLSPSCDWKGFYSKGLTKMEEIEKFNPQLIINPDWHSIDLAVKIKTDLSIPLVSQFFRIFSYFKNYIPNEEDYTVISRKEIQLVSQSDLVITLSQFDNEWAQEKGAKNACITYPPLSEEFIQALKASSTIDASDKIRLITVSRLVPEKNLIRIFPILKELEKLGLNFSYTLIGEPLDPQYSEKIKKTIETMKFHSKIRLIGRISLEEMIYQLRIHPIYLHTSSYEPFGITITEAVAAGCVVVLDQKGLIGAKEFMLHHPNLANTILIDYSNPKYSAEKIYDKIKSTQPIKHNEINSDFISELSPSQYVDNLVKIFRDFL